MIHDGYSRRCKLAGGARVLYRPYVASELWQRKRFRWELQFFDKETARRLLDAELFGQIVVWNLPMRVESVSMLRMQNPEDYEYLKKLILGTVPDASGEVWKEVEPRWAANLREGVILNLTDPRLANRSCEECQKYWYLRNGSVLKSNLTGERQLRPLDSLPVCQTEFGCPKGTPENQKSLNIANGYAWKHFRHCEAIGQFPDDPIVQGNAAIIRKAMADAKATKKKTVNSFGLAVEVEH